MIISYDAAILNNVVFIVSGFWFLVSGFWFLVLAFTPFPPGPY
jgi:hypothetical protein